jgi:hypothetical protein
MHDGCVNIASAVLSILIVVTGIAVVLGTVAYGHWIVGQVKRGRQISLEGKRRRARRAWALGRIGSGPRQENPS